MTIGKRILSAIMYASLAFGIAGGVVGLAYTRSLFLDYIRMRIDRELQTANSTILRYYLYGDVIGLRSTLTSLAKSNRWCTGALTDSVGNEVWRYSSDEGNLCNNKVIWYLGQNQVQSQRELNRTDGQKIGAILVSVPVIAETSLMYKLLISFFLPFLFFWILFIAVINLVLKRLLKPLSHFAGEMQSYAGELGFNNNSVTNKDEIWQLRALFSELRSRWRQSVDQVRKAESDIVFARISAQVAHDIRSPLTALNVMQRQLEGLTDDQRQLLAGAIHRISEISNNLRNRHHVADVEGVDVRNLVESLVKEKKVEWAELTPAEFQISVEGARNEIAFANASELKRILSNLLNNAFEALGETKTPKCTVQVFRKGDSVLIRVEDNGPGVPDAIADRIGQRGVTFGKHSGSGLGLSNAIEKVAGWGGKVEIHSNATSGTKVDVILRRSISRDVITDTLSFENVRSVIIVDDEDQIHKLWHDRLRGKGLELIHCFSAAEVDKLENQSDFLYLFDQNILGSEETGLKIIERKGISKQSILVTGSFDSSAVIQHAQKLDVRILPKTLVPDIPIVT